MEPSFRPSCAAETSKLQPARAPRRRSACRFLRCSDQRAAGWIGFIAAASRPDGNDLTVFDHPVRVQLIVREGVIIEIGFEVRGGIADGRLIAERPAGP